MAQTKEAVVIEDDVQQPEQVHPFLHTDVRGLRRKTLGIQCEVKFAARVDYLSFLATPDDIEEHGRNIYQECLDGKWGEVLDYVPTDAEILDAALATRHILLLDANQRVTDLQDLIDVDEATVADVAAQKLWKKYRVELNKVADQVTWPRTISWPKKPA